MLFCQSLLNDKTIYKLYVYRDVEYLLVNQ